MLIELTDKTFKKEVLDETQKAVIVDFWAPWCGPCRMQTPILEQFEKQYGAFVKVCKLNTDENQQAAQEYSVMSIPTLILFKNGKLHTKKVGVQNIEGLKALAGI